MKSVITESVRQAWHHALCAGVDPEGLFGFSVPLAKRLLTMELTELRRELGHARRERDQLLDEARAAQGDKLTSIRRRLRKRVALVGSLTREIRLLVAALARLSATGTFMPPARKERPATRVPAFDFRR